MPMPRWEDEDEYLTYLANMWDRLFPDFDPRADDERRFQRYVHDNWIALHSEAVGEADDEFHTKMRAHYLADDHLAMGDLLFDRIHQYTRACGVAQGILDE